MPPTTYGIIWYRGCVNNVTSHRVLLLHFFIEVNRGPNNPLGYLFIIYSHFISFIILDLFGLALLMEPSCFNLLIIIIIIEAPF